MPLTERNPTNSSLTPSADTGMESLSAGYLLKTASMISERRAACGLPPEGRCPFPLFLRGAPPPFEDCPPPEGRSAPSDLLSLKWNFLFAIIYLQSDSIITYFIFQEIPIVLT